MKFELISEEIIILHIFLFSPHCRHVQEGMSCFCIFLVVVRASAVPSVTTLKVEANSISACISGCIHAETFFVHSLYFSFPVFLMTGVAVWRRPARAMGEPRFNLSWTIHLLQSTFTMLSIYVVFVYMCICAFVYLYLCIFVFVYLCICAFVYLYLCICFFLCFCVFVYLYICVKKSVTPSNTCF